MSDIVQRLADARELDIRDEARRLGLDLAKGGRAFYRPGGRGPKGGSPSGSIYRKEGAWRWYEHAEGVGGDVVDLVQHVTGCSLGEALDALLGPNRKPLPTVRYDDTAEADEVPMGVRVRACTAFYDALDPLGDGAREWLATTRAITSATVSRFGLRQADESSGDRAMAAAIEAVGVEAVVSLGLGVPSKHSDSLRCPFGWGCWIAIPYRDGGELLHLQFRRYSRSGESKGPKYRHIKGEVPAPFNAVAMDGEHAPLLVEGAFDAMVLAQHGFPAVGIPGVSWLRQGDRAESIVRRAEAVCYGFDKDEAGEDARESVQALLRAAGAVHVSEVVWPPDFHGDWCDFYAEGRTLFEVREAQKPRAAGLVSFGDLMDCGIDDVLAEARGEIDRPGLRTGIACLDQWLRFTEGSYTLIGGRPSDGKSHLLLSIGQSVASMGIRVGVLSLEMNRPQMTERIAKAVLRVGRDAPADVGAVVARAALERDRLRHLPMVVDCPDDPREDSVRRRLDLLAEDGCDLILLDYVQMVRCKGNGIEERTSKASSLVKSWAQASKIPVVAAAALRRPENDREGMKRPRSESLRGSGMLEFDADVVLLMHNVARYDPDRGHAGVRDLYLDKNRNGLVTPYALQVEHPEPFGFFADLTYSTQMKMSGERR